MGVGTGFTKLRARGRPASSPLQPARGGVAMLRRALGDVRSLRKTAALRALVSWILRVPCPPGWGVCHSLSAALTPTIPPSGIAIRSGVRHVWSAPMSAPRALWCRAADACRHSDARRGYPTGNDERIRVRPKDDVIRAPNRFVIVHRYGGSRLPVTGERCSWVSEFFFGTTSRPASSVIVSHR